MELWQVTVKTNWDQRELDEKMIKQTKAFLFASGEHTANEFASNSPVITGALKNSMTYILNSGQTGFAKPPLTRPVRSDTVRAGSPLIYAASVTRRGKSAGWMENVWDRLVASKVFETIADKVMNI